MSNEESLLSKLRSKRTSSEPKEETLVATKAKPPVSSKPKKGTLMAALMEKSNQTEVIAHEKTKPSVPSIDRKLIAQIVRTPKSDLFSATQLWKMMGSENKLRPKYYMELEATQRFIESEYPKKDVSVENHGLSVKRAESRPFIDESICKIYKGRNGGTYMEKKLLLDYAQWLSPEIKSMVLDTFIEYGQIAMEKDPDKKAKRLIEKGFDTIVDLQVEGQTKQEAEDEKFERLKRAAAIATRKLFTSELEVITGKRMVDDPKLRNFVAYITDQLYIEMLGDSTKSLRQGLGLGTHSTPREAMNDSYLTAIHFAERAIVRYLRQNKETASPKGVLEVIRNVAKVQRPMLDMVDEWEPIATNVRKRKGSGFTKGTYSADRASDNTLNYSYDADIKKIGH